MWSSPTNPAGPLVWSPPVSSEQHIVNHTNTSQNSLENNDVKCKKGDAEACENAIRQHRSVKATNMQIDMPEGNGVVLTASGLPPPAKRVVKSKKVHGPGTGSIELPASADGGGRHRVLKQPDTQKKGSVQKAAGRAKESRATESPNSPHMVLQPKLPKPSLTPMQDLPQTFDKPRQAFANDQDTTFGRKEELVYNVGSGHTKPNGANRYTDHAEVMGSEEKRELEKDKFHLRIEEASELTEAMRDHLAELKDKLHMLNN